MPNRQIGEVLYIKGYRFTNGISVSLALNFHDIWVGCYWKRPKETIYQREFSALHLYICPIPCLVFHIITPGGFK